MSDFILSSIADKLEEFAEAAYEKGKEVLQAVADTVEPIIEDAFEKLVDDLGAEAVDIALALFGEAGKVAGVDLSGSEKADLSARQIIEAGVAKGITVAEQDATALIKNAYIAVKAKLASVPSTDAAVEEEPAAVSGNEDGGVGEQQAEDPAKQD